MTQDVPFNAHSANLTPTPLPLSPPAFGDHEGINRVERTQTRPLKPSTSTQDDRVIPGQGCTLLTPPLSAPYPDLGQNPPFGGARRPSVIVYKVTRGPNLAKSKDVVRISYGEGLQKRTRMKLSGRQSKVCGRGTYVNLRKVLIIVKRGDATMRLDMKSVRSCFYTAQRCHGMKQLLSTGYRRQIWGQRTDYSPLSALKGTWPGTLGSVRKWERAMPTCVDPGCASVVSPVYA
jgi:hypothetical protein